MADSDKNILITPNRGSATDLPKIEFTGADPNTITLSVLDDATLSFSGASGQLFSISDSLTGTIFSVNDVSGIPSIEVDDDGTVRLAEFAGNLLVGTDVDDGTNKLQVSGSISVTGGTSTQWNTAYGWGNHASAGYLTSLPSHNHTIANVTGLQAALNGKVDDSQVLTNVPSGAVFTDTNTRRGIHDTPVNGATTTSISSNWAFDNVKTAVPTGAVFTDTVYSHPTHPGDDISIDTGALSGATVISDLDFNVTTDGLGHVTDANATVSTRNLTAANIGAAAASHSHSNYLTTTGKAADSNLLDGIDSSRFVSGSNSNKTTGGDPSTLRPSGFYENYQGNSPTNTWYSYINMRHTNTGNGHGHQIAGSFYSNGDLYNRHYDGNGSFDGWSKIWNTSNDGSGSGLDADLLDGQHGSYYAPASHSHSLTLSGAVSGSGSVSGTISVTVNNDSHYHSQVFIPDTRGAARAPSYYPDKYVSFDFQNTSDTGAGGDSWHVLQTVSPWSSYNNAHRQQQLAFTGTGGVKFRYATSDSAWAGWQTMWTSGNDGSGSGLDADLLDGQHGSYYAPASSIGNGTVTITTSGSASGGGTFTLNQSGNTTINISATDTNSTYNFSGSAFVSRNSGNATAIDSATTNMSGYVNNSSAAGFSDGGAWVAAYSTSWVAQIFQNFRNGEITTRGKNNGTWQSWRKQWDSSNDGSGSGLDADLLDGKHASTSRNSANTIPIRDGNGYLNLGWINTTSGNTTSTLTDIYVNTNDGYIRKATPAHFRSQITDGVYLPVGAKAADSNLLDGLDHSQFLRDDGWNSSPGQNANTQTTMRSDFTYSNNAPHTGELIRFGASGYSLQLNSSYNDATNRLSFRTYNNDSAKTWNAWRQIWHDGNDGSGSGLDADLLDGQHASAFAPASHSHSYLPLSGGTVTGNLNVNGQIVVGNGQNSSYILMQDLNEGGRFIHCNSHRIGFLNNSNSWGSWCDDSGNWLSAGNVTAYASDERLKTNITTIANAVDKVKALKGVEYDWKDECESLGFIPTMKHETGVIAQNVQEVIPDAVMPAPFNEEYLTVDKEKIIPVLIEAIKEQQTQIDELQAQINILKGE